MNDPSIPDADRQTDTSELCVRFMPHWMILIRCLFPWFVVLCGCYGIVWGMQYHPSTSAFASQMTPFAIIILAIGFLAAAVRAFILWRYSVVTVFSDRLEYRTGFLSIRTSLVEVGEIASLEIRQTLFQRLFRFGDLYIDSRASAVLAIYGVSDVSKLKAMIRERRRAFQGQTAFRSNDVF